MTRRLTWLLLVAQVVTIVVHMGLQDLLAPTTRSSTMGFFIGLIYAYAAFRQLISERREQRGRLPIRLTAIILAIAIPLIVVVAFFVSTLAREWMRQDAVEWLQETNRSLTANVSLWLDLNLNALQQLVTLPDIVSMNPERQKPVLEAMATAYSHMYLVCTTDLDGINVARSDDAAPKDYSDRLWFLGARDGAPLTFQSLIGRTSGEPALVASMPIESGTGADAEITGVAIFASDLTNVAQQVQASLVGETGVAYVVDSGNQVIAHPDPAFSTELRDLSDYPPIVALREGKRGAVEFTDEEGVRWLAYVDELSGTGLLGTSDWGVVVQQQEAELGGHRGHLQQFQRTAWSVTFVSAILLGILASLAIRRTFMPIGALTETATAIAGGDLDRVTPVESEDEIGALARAFNSMTAQLRSLIGTLEQRVAERTRDLDRRARYLEASAQVAHDAASVLDLQQLLERVIALISANFGFYHAGIFLLDEAKEWAVLQAASSDGGRRMLARGHRLQIGDGETGEGIVGYASNRGEHRIALDVGPDAVAFANPNLPDTRSEIALPLQARGEIIGALDVQSTETEAFSEEDVAVLQTLADQVAMAISNARLFQQGQENLERAQRAYGELSRKAWTEMLRVRSGLGYHCNASGVTPIADHSDGHDEEGLPELAIPVIVRGRTIGTISAHKPGDEDEWTAEEIALMETLTDQLSVALESARLHQDTQRSAVRERLTGEVTIRMRESLDVDTVLKTAVREMQAVLDLAEAEVYIAPPTLEQDGRQRM